MKRVVVLVLMLGLILAGCGGLLPKGDSSNSTQDDNGKNKEGKTEIKFWSFWGSDPRKATINKIIDDYNKSQDKVVVKYTYLPWGDIWTKNLAAVAAGNPADVVINDINSTALRGLKNQAEDITDLAQKDNLEGQFSKELWQASQHEGKVYGIPFNTDTRILFYNKDAFKEAGLDPNKPPETWEELEKYATMLDKKKGDTYERIGFYPLFGVGPDIWLMNKKHQNYIDDEGKVTLNTQENINTMNWLKKWQDKYGTDVLQKYQAKFDSQQGNPFFDGSVAMIVKDQSFATQLDDFAKDIDYGVVELPAATQGEEQTSWGGGFVAEVPKGSKHKEEAYDFIKYLTNEQNQKLWAEETFDLVANEKAAEAAGKNLTGNKQQAYQTAVDNMKQTILTPVPVDAPEYFNLVNPQLDNIMQGKKSPEEGLEKAQKDVEKLVEQNRK
ncbi:ABC transporter substrate-binding protein [Macrococcus hajekii]|uniref:ABC transporter substrate-binding protein n=1 Tax=Macrococcus hajekii TaxID=198482 RepID=A0A4R6BHS0_9STAP|nr:ABC transporter substrate-binding protein [Macrococcus hajekii]TDM01140.1 ABC transporter substrate-binding protein [Macrococcus hajekii]GGB12147.1 ABC transporter substrate-binding protein [Macrococcus hajekii]